MGLLFYWIPARNGQDSQNELNTSLRELRILSVEKHFHPCPSNPGWAICVEYAEPNLETSAKIAGSKRIDYREVLDPETFALFVELRKLRKEIADNEGVPVYTVLTNEQIASIAQKRIETLNDFESIDGIGTARTKKYGQRFLDVIRQKQTSAKIEKVE